MHDELTEQDILQMKQELGNLRTVVMPAQIKAVQEARAFGDLSENFEYKAAKMELNKTKRRIRYLDGMISTAVVVTDHSASDTIGLFDRITVKMPITDEPKVFQIVTTMRADALQGRITKESPVGSALFGRKAGETVRVQVSPDFGYDLQIISVEKVADDGSIKINEF